jgi:hypothetical protein
MARHPGISLVTKFNARGESPTENGLVNWIVKPVVQTCLTSLSGHDLYRDVLNSMLLQRLQETEERPKHVS